MSLLNPTPPERLLDKQGRPYFLWDCKLTLDEFLAALRTGDLESRAYLIAKLMRQAKPDDVFQFTTTGEIASLWSAISRFLGKSRGFWVWLLSEWGVPIET
jgi:hypothetical protein